VITLSLEIPAAMPELRALTDFDFILAQELIHKDYAKMYKIPQRSSYLDNGFHETGHPLSVDELFHLWRATCTKYVIAPDKFGDSEFSYKGFRDALEVFPSKTAVPVLVGETRLERQAYFDAVRRDCGTIALPYRADRVTWWQEILGTFGSQAHAIHLLGWRDWDELAFWKEMSKETYVSLDTAKPVKWGLLGKRLYDISEIRGAPIKSSDIASLAGVTPEQRAFVYYNVAVLRKALSVR
jgi:hypothetical protein